MSQKTFPGQKFIRGRFLPVWQGGLIVLVVCLAYLPALRGGFVWDDDWWTTNLSALFQDTSGLRLIWFQPTALQQYYPLTGTTFWLDYQLWKFWTPPYHVENVLLHALAALLFWRLLLQLRVPGAWLASAIFALHPVMVESVAWITERKNVLSLVLYLGAWLAYVRYAQGVTEDGCPAFAKLPPSPGFGATGRRGKQVTGTDSILSPVTHHPSFFYGLAFILFLGALLAKTTTFSLPAAILLIGWWQRGQIRWRADVLPTLPFFAVAIGLCLVTSWLEKNHVGAQGPDFALTFPQRCLIAGRAFWFYLGNLFWPAKLCFVYPRWQPNPGSGWHWLHPVTAIGALFTLWLARGRLGRGPVTALFFFVGTLFPVLGFMNVYGMRFSFVWDHWVYLSALGIIALAAALVVRVAEFLRAPAAVYGFAAIVLPVLALLTWRQAGMYTDAETLWRKTLARNPDCWMAHGNLGSLLGNQGHIEEAMEHYHKAIRINPNCPDVLNDLGIFLANNGRLDEAIENYRKAIQIDPNYLDALNNLGRALAANGRFDEAIACFQKALQIKPDYADADINLGIALLQKGKVDEAIVHCQMALQINPHHAKAHCGLGNALFKKGKMDEAIAHYQKALEIKPDYADAHNNLGSVLLQKGQVDEAIIHFQMALHIKSDNAEVCYNLGNALLQKGQVDEAIVHFQKALQIKPDYAGACYNLGNALLQKGRVDEAIAQYQMALQIKPDSPGILNNLAWLLATCPDAHLRNGVQAVKYAERACELTHYGVAPLVGTLAAAYAEAGRFDDAMAAAQKACALAAAAGEPKLLEKNQKLLVLYRSHQPYHEAAPKVVPATP